MDSIGTVGVLKLVLIIALARLVLKMGPSPGEFVEFVEEFKKSVEDSSYEGDPKIAKRFMISMGILVGLLVVSIMLLSYVGYSGRVFEP